jgi:hypothetical protein
MAIPWEERPFEEASLFNPAFGALLVAKTVRDFSKHLGEGLPYPLAFLVLPAVLHPGIRAVLPATTNAIMQNWIADQSGLLSEFPGRVRLMKSVSKESVVFALLHRKLTLSNGRLLAGERHYPMNAEPHRQTEETRACLSAAAFLGRWFAAAGTTATVLSSWGVRP